MEAKIDEATGIVTVTIEAEEAAKLMYGGVRPCGMKLFEALCDAEAALCG